MLVRSRDRATPSNCGESLRARPTNRAPKGEKTGRREPPCAGPGVMTLGTVTTVGIGLSAAKSVSGAEPSGSALPGCSLQTKRGWAPKRKGGGCLLRSIT